MNPVILLAEDGPQFRDALKNMFEDEGYTVYEAEDAECLKRLAPKCHVWVVDARLPTHAMEGVQAVVDLVRSGVRPKSGVLFTSVSPEAEARSLLLELQAHAQSYTWIEKPYELERILKLIRGVML